MKPPRPVPSWKLRHENRRATKPVKTPHAARLLELLNMAGDCTGYEDDADRPGSCRACGAGRALHHKPGTQNKMWWEEER